MRKDDVITLCDFTEDGQMISYAKEFANPEMAPLEYRASKDYLKKWWSGRQAPIRQGNLEKMLDEKGIGGVSKYLLKNLGLSLTDYYWIKPVNTSLKWKDVSFFINDFKENILQSISDEIAPNSSLGGELEKTWNIRRGKRVLIKGNHGELSGESINEVIASRIHEMQGYDNHTKYELVKIKDKPYDWGCISEAFTSEKLELVSANAIITSEERPQGVSFYEHLINVAKKHGIDEVQFRKDLEYQILTDYILSNTDRHMDNLGVLRDAESMKFVRMAPIFDSGRAFGAVGVVPYTDEEIDNIQVNSFESNEKKLLKLVRDRNLIDMEKLPSADFITEWYTKDSKVSQARIKSIARLYEAKVSRLLSC